MAAAGVGVAIVTGASRGIGAATADPVSLIAPGDANVPAAEVRIFDKVDRIKLLGSLGLGVAF